MSTISQIKIGNTNYEIMDATSRTELGNIDNRVKTLEDSVNLDNFSTVFDNSWTIPENVLKHRLIILIIGKYGRFDTKVLTRSDIIQSRYAGTESNQCLLFLETAATGWYVTIDNNSVLRINGTLGNPSSNPSIFVRGIL